MIKNKITLNKVILLFFLLISFVSFLFIYSQYRTSREILIQSYLNKYALLALQVKEHFSSAFDKAFYAFKNQEKQNILNLYKLPYFYSNGKVDVVKIAKFLNKYNTTKSGHYEVFLLDRNYTIVKSSNEKEIGKNLGKNPFFKKIIGDVFKGTKQIEMSYINLDVSSMELKKYYFIRTLDAKYIIGLAYVVSIYDSLKDIYDFVKPTAKSLDVYFVDKYMIYKLNMNKNKISNQDYKTSYKIICDILDRHVEEKNPRKMLGYIFNLFEKNNNLLKRIDLSKHELTIFTLINSLFEQVNSKVIIKLVYDISNLKKDLDKLNENLLITLLLFVLVFAFMYVVIVFRITKPLMKLIDKMKQNKPCYECDSYIQEIDDVKNSYNILHSKLNKEIEKNKNLLELNRRFIVDTIHQIRTPLQIIMLNMDLLKFQIKDKDVEEIIEEIDAAVAMLTNSYEDLAYLSSNNTAITYKPALIDIAKVLKSRMGFFSNIAKVNDKRLVDNIKEDSIEYMINRIEFERIIDNNISNAIKYSTGSDIEITLKKESDRVVLTFASEGDPIKNPDKIFDKNYREQAHKRGLGLGLNIVKNICDKYSIKYRVYYKDGKNVFEYVFKL